MQARASEFWSRFVSRCEEIAVLLREDDTARLGLSEQRFDDVECER